MQDNHIGWGPLLEANYLPRFSGGHLFLGTWSSSGFLRSPCKLVSFFHLAHTEQVQVPVSSPLPARLLGISTGLYHRPVNVTWLKKKHPGRVKMDTWPTLQKVDTVGGVGGKWWVR